MNLDLRISAVTSAVTSIGTFKVMDNGSIAVYTATSGITDKSFRINYRSKDGSDKAETVIAITLENAKSMIKDLDYMNYHIEG